MKGEMVIAMSNYYLALFIPTESGISFILAPLTGFRQKRATLQIYLVKNLRLQRTTKAQTYQIYATFRLLYGFPQKTKT